MAVITLASLCMYSTAPKISKRNGEDDKLSHQEEEENIECLPEMPHAQDQMLRATSVPASQLSSPSRLTEKDASPKTRIQGRRISWSSSALSSDGWPERHPHTRPVVLADTAKPMVAGNVHDAVQALGNDPEQCNDMNSIHNSPDAIGDEYRLFGHSSSWSFSRRIRSFISNHIPGAQLHDLVPIADGAYGTPFEQPILDLSGIDLPPEDYAEYLTNTLYFTLAPLYYLFDKGAFLGKMRDFYLDEKAGKKHEAGLWHIKMLLVFAFGKSILAREVSQSGPTGVIYFARAVEALPDPHRLRQDPILSIEVLSMLALFMQAMDMRRAAYDYVGQAIRISLTQGLNRRYDAQRITPQEFEHRSRLWWTVYTIERKLSSLVGVPPSVHDEDIALPMPPIDPTNISDLTIALHVNLSSQLGRILTIVYGLGHQRLLGVKFIAAVQTILKRLAETSILLHANMRIELLRLANTISRVAASLHLLHHQCTILTIRPVIFFLLETKLANSNVPLKLSDAVIGLLRVCVESALQVLRIVEGLRAHNLVDLFLPFDLESMFASAFVLILVDIIMPANTEQWDLGTIFALIDEMMLRGIVVAGPYKQDLLEIDELRRKLKRPQVLQTNQMSETRPFVPNSGMTTPNSNYPPLEQDMLWSWMANEERELGVVNPNTIQSAIDGLNFDFLNDPSVLNTDALKTLKPCLCMLLKHMLESKRCNLSSEKNATRQPAGKISAATSHKSCFKIAHAWASRKNVTDKFHGSSSADVALPSQPLQMKTFPESNYWFSTRKHPETCNLLAAWVFLTSLPPLCIDQ
ncbi:unnamed protein product [Diplocarpon coronariae]